MSSTSSQLVVQLNDEITRAGAGAGKTTALVQRVMELIEYYKKTKGTWPHLVVTTFTKKATQELRERLTVEACRRGDLQLLDYCRSQSSLHISTMHGVLGLFLRRYGHLVGFDSSFQILSRDESQRLKKQIFLEVMSNHEDASYWLEKWTIDRLIDFMAAFDEGQSIYENWKPESLESLQDFYMRKLKRLSVEGLDIAAAIRSQTDHLGWIDIAQYLESLNLVFESCSSGEKFEELKQMLKTFPRKPAKRKGISVIDESLEQEFVDWRDRTKNWLEDPGHHPEALKKIALESDRFSRFAQNYIDHLRQRKMDSGQIEMQDLELFAIRILRENPALAEAFGSDWDHWLIDEYQDTNPLQISILKMLIQNRPRYLVGDPQQSIYLFRGARSEVFAREELSFKERGLVPQVKIKNYRSHPSLLEFMNRFLTQLPSRFHPMEPRDYLFEPERKVAYFFESTEEKSRLVEYENLARHIESLVKSGSLLSDICILARKNKTLMEIAQFLKSLGYPTHVHASQGFAQRREVLDALAILQFLVHPFDNQNLIILLRSPWFRIEDEILAQTCVNFKAQDSFWLKIKKNELATHPSIQMLDEIRLESEKIGYAIAWERALVRLGVLDFSFQYDSTGRREANLWKLITDLREKQRQPGFKILDFVRQIKQIQSESAGDEEGDAVTAVEANVIQLMTVHASKGLQRPHVIIPHCDEGLKSQVREAFIIDEGRGVWSLGFRENRSSETLFGPNAAHLIQELKDREVQEHDRLLYVAVTRAQDTVYFSWNHKVHPLSWAAKWKWNVEKIGDHNLDQFSYHVYGPPQEGPKSFQPENAKESQIREPWLGDDFSQTQPELLSVTTLIEQNKFVENLDSVEIPLKLAKALEGTLLHQYFDQLRLNSHRSWSEILDRLGLDHQSSLVQHLDWVWNLTSPPMKELLQGGKSEWAFRVQIAEVQHLKLLNRETPFVLDGQIDLWGKVEDEIWLIDYKSGSPRYIEKAMAQLSIYALAIRKFGWKEKINRAVLYPIDQMVMIRPYEDV